MNIHQIDHIVMTVRDVEETCRFYQRVLGMQVVTFGHRQKALRFGNQKINLHEAGRELEPKAAKPTPGAVDVCFLTSTPLDEVIRHVRAYGVEIVEGPVSRAGATGL